MPAAGDADAPGADEFDCIDCGRHIISLPAGSSRWTAGRCATCFSLPGWFLIDELRVRFEPDEDWRTPVRPAQGADPADWRCEVPGCAARTPLIRISGYDEPFRGRCPDHLDPDIWRHRQRNRREP